MSTSLTNQYSQAFQQYMNAQSPSNWNNYFFFFYHDPVKFQFLSKHYPDLGKFNLDESNDRTEVFCCALCKEIPIEPVLSIRTDTIYCKSCIYTLPDSECVFVEAAIIKLFYDTLAYRCKLCGSKCTSDENLTGFADHVLLRCEFKCINEECKEMLSFSNAMNHIESCAHAAIRCPYGKFIEEHKIQSAPFPCPYRGSPQSVVFHLQGTQCDKLLAVLQHGLNYASPQKTPTAVIEEKTSEQTNQQANPHKRKSSSKATENPEVVSVKSVIWQDKSEVYSIRILQTPTDIYIRWPDLVLPVIPSSAERTKELKYYVDKRYIRFFSIKDLPPAYYITLCGLKQYLQGSKNWTWKYHPYGEWMKSTLLAEVEALARNTESAVALTELSDHSDHVSSPEEESEAESESNSNKKQKLGTRTIATIVARILTKQYNNPDTKNQPIGLNREALVMYVRQLCSAEELEQWDAFDAQNAKECNKDFSRGVTRSPYKTGGRGDKLCRFRRTT